MAIEFEAPPEAGSLDELRNRIDGNLSVIAFNLDRVFALLHEHPLNRELEGRLRQFSELLSQAAERTEQYADRLAQPPAFNLDTIANVLEEAAKFCRQVAYENAPHPASVMGKPIRRATPGTS